MAHADEVAGDNDPVRGKGQRDRSAGDQGDQLLSRAFSRLARHWIKHADVGVPHNLLGLHSVPIDVTFRGHRNYVARPQTAEMQERVTRGDVMRCAHLVYGTTAAAAERLLSPLTKHRRNG